MMADPAFTMLARRVSGLRILADLRTEEGVRQAFGVSTYPASVLYASGEWIRGHREATAKLARSITRTLAWMHDHSADEIAAKSPPEFRGEDAAVYVDALRHSMPMFSPDGAMDGDGAEAVRQLLAQSMDKVRTAKIDLSSTYTNEFVRR
jgi:NitT/TauT family transport system substrate-binding protein